MRRARTAINSHRQNRMYVERAATIVEYIAAVSIIFVVLTAGLTNLTLILKKSAQANPSGQSTGPCGDLLGEFDCM